jgi:hypothetical protein
MSLTSVPERQLSASKFKNRIINGDMNIAIQYGTTEVTPTAVSTYVVDRWKYQTNVASKLKFLQYAIADLSNFYYDLKSTVVTETTPSSTQYFVLTQAIEGYNLQDFNFGTANASPIVLSFWVRASVEGTYSGSLRNAAINRCYVFTFPVTTSWVRQVVIIPGDTTGTWQQGGGTGVQLHFNLGTGATYLGTAGEWSANAYLGATGSVQFVDCTAGSTFEITGVQFEKGLAVTDFEFRPFAIEKMLCSRY